MIYIASKDGLAEESIQLDCRSQAVLITVASRHDIVRRRAFSIFVTGRGLMKGDLTCHCHDE